MRLTLRGQEQSRDGWRLEDLQLTTGQAQAVGEVLRKFFTHQGTEVVAHDDTLGQGFVHGHGQASA